jgi:hypothetical protein
MLWINPALANKYLGDIWHAIVSLKSSHQQTALTEIEVEIRNLLAAWYWAGQHQHVTQLAQAMNSLG